MKVYMLRIKTAQKEIITISQDFHQTVREYHLALENNTWPLLYMVDLDEVTIQRIGWEKEGVK